MLPCLAPAPRKIELTNGTFNLGDTKFILLQTSKPHALLFTATQLQNRLMEVIKRSFEIHAGKSTGLANTVITLRITTKDKLPPQGYHLSISSSGINIDASGEPGIFYGCCTLI